MKGKLSIFIFSLSVLFACDEGADGFGFDDLSSSGSIATFYVDNNELYVIQNNSEFDNRLLVFDITDHTEVSKVYEDYMDRNVETISKLGDILFLGTTTGVLFYDVSDPVNPVWVSDYNHITGCDPVVSDGDYAYSTLRSTGCGSGADVLDIIDISNLEKPELVNSVQMISPYGLAVVGNNLFVGEGRNGMVWFDISDKKEVVEIGRYPEMYAYDFIPKGDMMIVKTSTSLIQFTYQNNEISVDSEFKYEN